ncbi:hypothetical protein EII18_07330 [Comamonadaceae bacterium OH3737_COT-264]|nr:hypothetical protein EII18_07330 [Comamonadaceae bacterium OH3737_COT-264]
MADGGALHTTRPRCFAVSRIQKAHKNRLGASTTKNAFVCTLTQAGGQLATHKKIKILNQKKINTLSIKPKPVNLLSY